MKKSIVCQLFYPSIAQQLIQKLKQMDDGETSFFINIQGNSSEHDALLEEARSSLKNVFVLKTPNKGRDIGAKLLLIDLLLQLKTPSSYTLIIHDKKSPHLENGHVWRDALFKITEAKHLNKVFTVFEDNPDVGLIGTSQFIQNEFSKESNTFACSCNSQIQELMKKYSIQTDDYDFLAGNIFWIRTDLLKTFFEKRSILQVRADLEPGNALDFSKGTYIHSWERIMSWIATSQGYKLYGI